MCHCIRACCVLHNLSRNYNYEEIGVEVNATATEIEQKQDAQDNRSDEDDENRAHNAVAKNHRNFIASLLYHNNEGYFTYSLFFYSQC